MGPSRIFILRPVATALFMLAIVLAGLVGFRLLSLSALPEVDYPTIQVTTLYPGGSPEVMSQTVTAPLERQFGEMPGLTRMASTSSAGASVVTLQFTLTEGLDVAEQEVQAAINASTALLPADLPAPPVYAKINPADAPIMTIAITSDTMPLTQVQSIVDTRLAQKISQISGVGLVGLAGGQKPAMRIRADTQALSSYGLSLAQLRTAIDNANANSAKGSFDGPNRAYQINANDQLESVEDYQNLIISYQNNAPVRLKDVAQVIEGAENTRLGALANSTPAIILNVQRQPGANVIQTTDAIKAQLPELLKSLPAGLHAEVLADRTTGIRASVHDVEFELVLAVVLVVLVIFFFLHSARATLVAGLAVPISLIGTFGVMYLLNYSLDNLSLMALTIATGFVVDDAIVMIENIQRHIEDGMKPFDAALKGAGEIGFTIISLTVSLIAVLIPLLFMGDIVGRLFREFAVTLAVTILISAVVSLTLTPMLSARWLKEHGAERPSRIAQRSADAFSWVEHHYTRGLDFGARAAFRNADGGHRDAGADGVTVPRHSQGPVPDAGHGPASGADRRHHRRLLRSHGAAAGAGGGRDPARQGRSVAVVLRRRRRCEQHHAQFGHDAGQSQGEPQRPREGDAPAQAGGRPDSRPDALPAADAGSDDRRRERADPVSCLGRGVEHGGRQRRGQAHCGRTAIGFQDPQRHN